MALMYAKTMMARLQYETGKGLGEWGNLLSSRTFLNREDVNKFLLKEGLSPDFIGFMFWTLHSRMKYVDPPDGPIFGKGKDPQGNSKSSNLTLSDRLKKKMWLGTKTLKKDEQLQKDKSIKAGIFVRTKISVEDVDHLMLHAKAAGEELQKIIEDIAKRYTGVTLSPMSFPGRQNLQWKANYEYDGDVNKIKDVFSITIIVPADFIGKFINEFGGHQIVERIKIEYGGTHPLGYGGTTVIVKLNGVKGEVQINTAAMIYGKEHSRNAARILGYDEYKALKEHYDTIGIDGGLGLVHYEKYRWLLFDFPRKKFEIGEIPVTSGIQTYDSFITKLRGAANKPVYFINTLEQAVIRFNGRNYFVKFNGEESFIAKKGSIVVVEGILEHKEITKNKYYKF